MGLYCVRVCWGVGGWVVVGVWGMWAVVGWAVVGVLYGVGSMLFWEVKGVGVYGFFGRVVPIAVEETGMEKKKERVEILEI